MSGIMTGLTILGTITLIILSMIMSEKPVRRQEEDDPGRPMTGFAGQKGSVISPGDAELLAGPITLTVDPGSKSRLVSYLVLSLSEDPNIQVISKAGIAAKDSLIRLFIKSPVPLFKVLYNIPVVQEVTKQGYDIHIVTI